MITKLTTLFLVVWVSIAPGCKSLTKDIPPPDYNRPLPPGALGLRKITDPAEIPNFTPGCFDLYGLNEGIANSLNFLSKPSSQNFFPYDQITHEHAVASLEAFYELLESGINGEQLNAEIRQRFDVYTSVGYDDQGTVLFTGYYTPIFNGSLELTAQFQFPLYRQPEDLIKTDTGEILGRRLPNGSTVQYPSRQEIESSNMLAGNELVWLEDAFEAYVAHVQGSAVIRLNDGNRLTVGYTANNGHEYNSAAQEMVADGLLTPDQLNLSSMISFFKANPHRVSDYTQRNPRFVFFAETFDNPHGSINEPVITLRTIATDKTVFPPAGITFINTQLPRTMPGGAGVGILPYSGFALDQDTGGAIRAPGRCDVYMGIGDQAGQLAGSTYQEGRLHYLFLKQ
ncbi:MAG: hypothetical protein GY869_19455 [Planctomycetes bacterium]|nr:hypothetical protein [Planctomycetota bacterium]